MRFLQLCAATLLAVLTTFPLGAQTTLPVLPRHPVRQAPVIFGRKIEQFVLLQPAVYPPHGDKAMDNLRGFSKGLFLPVSEDAWGVFYHSVNGAVVARWTPPYGDYLAEGGIYVSKIKPNVAYGYFGDARRPDGELTQTYRPLPKEVIEKFRIAETAPRERQPSVGRKSK